MTNQASGNARTVHDGANGDGFDDGRNGRLNAAVGERRLHLTALDAVIAEQGGALACGLVSRGGGAPVLNVVSRTDKSRSVDVGCERVGGRWWLVLAGSGEGVVPVEEIEDAPGVLVALVEGPAGAAGGSGVGR